MINDQWIAFKLLPNAINVSTLIGVTEMLAVEFSVQALLTMFPGSAHFLIHTDNQGVLHSIKFGTSKGLLQNESLSRFSASLLNYDSFITPKYVPSKLNPADPLSRGILPPLSCRCHVPILVDSSIRSILIQI